MTAQQAVVGIYKALESGNTKNLVEKTRKAARAAGFKFSNAELSSWLSRFVHPSLQIKDAKGRFKGSRTEMRTGSTDGVLSTKRTGHPDGRPDSRAVIVPLLEFVVPSGSKEPSGVPRNGRPKATPDDAWVAPLLASLQILSGRKLESLDPNERLLLGRWFAYEIGNCTKQERRNLSHGVAAASGLASICYGQFGEWTVAMYRDLSCRAKKMRGGVPCFDPWIFKAALAAPERQAL